MLVTMIGQSLCWDRNIGKDTPEVIGGLTDCLGVNDDCPREGGIVVGTSGCAVRSHQASSGGDEETPV